MIPLGVGDTSNIGTSIGMADTLVCKLLQGSPIDYQAKYSVSISYHDSNTLK